MASSPNKSSHIYAQIKPWRQLSRNMFKSSSLKRKRCCDLNSPERLDLGKRNTGDRVEVVTALRWRDESGVFPTMAIVTTKRKRDGKNIMDTTDTVTAGCTINTGCWQQSADDDRLLSQQNINSSTDDMRVCETYKGSSTSNKRTARQRHNRMKISWARNCHCLLLLLSFVVSISIPRASLANNNQLPRRLRKLQTINNPTPIPSRRTVEPSSLPSSRPSTHSPSLRPSSQPSKKSSTQPSLIPTSNPTAKPSISIKPSNIPSKHPISQPSVKPSLRPSMEHSEVPSSQPSNDPTGSPSVTHSFSPSFAPSTSHYPSYLPSNLPSQSMIPSANPSSSHQPSTIPTLQPSLVPTNEPSTKPSQPPSTQPSISSSPTQSPSISIQPSAQPSEQPSSEPTNKQISQIDNILYQELFGLEKILNSTQEELFQNMIESYKVNITNGTFIIDRVEMICTVYDQQYISGFKVNLSYKVSFKSKYTRVESYGTRLQVFLNDNIDQMVQTMNDKGIPVTKSSEVYNIEDVTDSPTISPSYHPSKAPTSLPTYTPSFNPTSIPSQIPSTLPSSKPSVFPSSTPTLFHSSSPSLSFSEYPSSIPSQIPSSSPTINISSSTTIIVSVTVAVSGVAVILVAGLCLRKKYKPYNNENSNLTYTTVSNSLSGGGRNTNATSSERPSRANGILGGGIRASSLFRGTNNNVNTGNRRNQNLSIDVLPSDDSLISPNSVISTGSSVNGGGSDDEEYDGTQVLADEFEKYKDRNLEKMRANLEGNVSNFDSMMSQALTNALMDDDEEDGNEPAIMIGEKDSVQIEVDLLCEMNDWLKRTDGAGIDDK